MASRQMSWWVISDVNLRAMLQRVADGEDVDLVILEEYANTDHIEGPPERRED